jgi:poly(hydroxyalkanoate) depolymerase family esterase
MAGLARTISNLSRQHGDWTHLLKGAEGAARPTPPSRVREIHDFGANPGNLRMLEYVPANLAPGPALVVVLHGCTQTAAGYDHGAGWSTMADRHGFALLFPEQKRENNPNSSFNWFEPRDTGRDLGEALSIRRMVERMVAEHGIDRGRIFVTGLSAGGAMASALLASYPDLFAGGAIVAGLPYGAAANVQEAFDCMFKGCSRPARAWGDRVRAASPHRGPWPKISVWHGTADRTVVPANAAEIVKQWTDVHGLASTPDAETRGPGFTRKVWRDPTGRELVESFTIANMAHGTPLATGEGEGCCGAAGPFLLEVGVSSTHHIAAFFGLTGSKVEQPAEPAARVAPEPAPRAAREPTIEIAPRPREPALVSGGGAEARAEVERPPGKKLPIDIQAVITKALTAAGLMKP